MSRRPVGIRVIKKSVMAMAVVVPARVIQDRGRDRDREWARLVNRLFQSRPRHS